MGVRNETIFLDMYPLLAQQQSLSTYIYYWRVCEVKRLPIEGFFRPQTQQMVNPKGGFGACLRVPNSAIFSTNPSPPLHHSVSHRCRKGLWVKCPCQGAMTHVYHGGGGPSCCLCVLFGGSRIFLCAAFERGERCRGGIRMPSWIDGQTLYYKKLCLK